MTTRFTQVFLLDAGVTGLVGLVLALAGGFLESPLGLPAALMRGVGLSFLVFAVLLGYVALQKPPRVNLAWFVVGYNALWSLASLLFLLVSGLEPTPLGTAFILFQALVVGVFAILQFLSLRRLLPTLPAARSR